MVVLLCVKFVADKLLIVTWWPRPISFTCQLDPRWRLHVIGASNVSEPLVGPIGLDEGVDALGRGTAD